MTITHMLSPSSQEDWIVRSRSPWLVLFAWTTALIGCSQKSSRPAPEKLATVPVTGTVRFQGKPLANASVRFQSQDGKVSAGGTTDTDGKFTLTTYTSGDGAPVGTYVVTIAVSAVREIEPGVLDPNLHPSVPIPPQYSQADTTPLKAEVKASGSNSFEFTIP